MMFTLSPLCPYLSTTSPRFVKFNLIYIFFGYFPESFASYNRTNPETLYPFL
jgi:hypothetical protein